jgi:hypothetical protein
MTPPPAQIDGANVLLWTDALATTRPTGRTTHRVKGQVIGPAGALAICQYDGDAQFYLFYCDENWNVRTDTAHGSLIDAKEQAEFEYEGVSQTWRGRADAPREAKE